MSDLDLDDLLDEALNDLDENEEKNKKKAQKKDEAVDEAVQKANMSNPADALQLQKMLEALMGSSPEDVDINGITDNLRSVVDMLDAEGVSDEDRETLKQLKNALSSLNNEDFDGAAAALQNLPEGGPGALPSSNPEEAEQYAQRFQQGSSNIEDELAETLLKTCTSPEMLSMMELMTQAFPAWIEAHPNIPPEDLERHKKQHQMSSRICALLKENADNNNSNNAAEIFSILSDFSELGDLPEGLSDYAPAGSVPEEASES